MEQRSSAALENITSSEGPSTESPSANLDTSSTEIQPSTPGGTATSAESSPGSAIVDTSPLSDSGYTETNSSTVSADSTQAQDGGGSLESSPSKDAVVISEERYVRS